MNLVNLANSDAESCGDGAEPTLMRSTICHSSYSLYVSESYCETYAYPLLVYLPEGDSSERDLWKWFPSISDQNFLGLGIRPPFPHPLGLPHQFHWKLRRPDASLACIRDAVFDLSEDWLFQESKISLFGEGDGAVVALQNLILQQSAECVGVPVTGVVCRSLPDNWTSWLPHVGSDLQGRLLLLDPIRNADEVAAIDALSDAGIDVTFAHTTAPPATVVNHWIMAGISTAIF